MLCFRIKSNELQKRYLRTYNINMKVSLSIRYQNQQFRRKKSVTNWKPRILPNCKIQSITNMAAAMYYYIFQMREKKTRVKLQQWSYLHLPFELLPVEVCTECLTLGW